MTSLRIRTPSRLHFGLLGWGSTARRQYGGVGLMVDEPGLEIVAEPWGRWEASGPMAERALNVATDLARQLERQGSPVGPVRLTNLRVPESHIGLGVGTQLSLAVARAITELAGLRQIHVETLARMTARGRRSGIGIHGFAEGGLIVDAGRRAENDLPTKLMRLPLPATWSILVVVPESRQGLHGAEELEAFRFLPDMPESLSDRLCRLVLLGLLPAVLETDLDAFGASLNEIQKLVGSMFAPVQGGRFGNPEVEMLVETMIGLGLRGVGQSSWGPTLYAFSDEEELERERLRQTLITTHSLISKSVFWTRASRSGACISAR